jgi:hypothetical protein
MDNPAFYVDIGILKGGLTVINWAFPGHLMHISTGTQKALINGPKLDLVENLCKEELLPYEKNGSFISVTLGGSKG